MEKKIFLDGPRAPRSTILKKKLGLWGRECQAPVLGMGPDLNRILEVPAHFPIRPCNALKEMVGTKLTNKETIILLLLGHIGVWITSLQGL